MNIRVDGTITEMNPSFYPKHLARQYAQNGALRTQNEGPSRVPNFERPWAQVYPLPGGENSHPINNNNSKYGDQQQVVIDGQVQEQQTVGNMRRVEARIKALHCYMHSYRMQIVYIDVLLSSFGREKI